jgi:hypothetical protein
VAKNLHGKAVQVEVYKTKEELGDHVQFIITDEGESSVGEANTVDEEEDDEEDETGEIGEI